MTANEKVAQRKLSMLQLAQELKSVSEACRLMGYSRSQFYEIKRAFQTGGLQGLLDKPPIPGSTPHRLPDDLEKEIVELSIEHPAFGQQRISDEMALREKMVRRPRSETCGRETIWRRATRGCSPSRRSPRRRDSS